MSHEPRPLDWRISTASASGTDCVAVAATDTGVAVRNSNFPDRGTLHVDPAAFGTLLDAIKTDVPIGA